MWIVSESMPVYLTVAVDIVAQVPFTCACAEFYL